METEGALLLYILKFYTLYTFLLYITFLHVLNKTKLWLTQCGGTLKYLGESVMVCAWGQNFSLQKGVIRASALASPLRATIPTQLTRHSFQPKQIMTSSEHCVVMSQWCRGFWMVTFMSASKGYKRKMHKSMGIPVFNSRVPRFKFQVHRAKLTSLRVLQCIPAPG